MDILNSLQSIGFDWRLGVAHLINFLIVVGLLRYFLFDPLKERLEERRETVKQGVADAQEAEKIRFEAEESAQDIVTEAKQEKREILESAHEEGEALKQNMKQEAERGIAAKKEAAEKKLAADREKMERALESEVGALAVQAAERIIEREVTQGDHDRLVRDVIETAGNA